MFPVTLNGNTYNSADFTGSSYPQKFGQFAYDLMMDPLVNGSTSVASVIATSVTSNSYGTGSKSFTIASGKGFKPGMPVTIYRTDTLSLSAMHGVVSSYSGSSLVVQVVVANAPDAVASTNWVIGASIPIETIAGTWSISNGGTGQTTAEPAYEALFLPKYDTRPRYTDDMLHCMPTSPAYSGGTLELFALPGKKGYVAQGGVIQPANLRALHAAGVPNLSRHPGLIEMSVKQAGGKAVMVYPHGVVTLPSTPGGYFEFGIYIPEFCTASDTEQFDLWVGFGRTGTTDHFSAGAGTFNPALVSTPPVPPVNSCLMCLNYRPSGPTLEGEDTVTNPAGKPLVRWTKIPGWFVFSINSAEYFLDFGVFRDDEFSAPDDPYVYVTSGSGPVSVTNGQNLCYPVIYLYKKLGGVKEFKVYVDYWHYGLDEGANLAR